MASGEGLFHPLWRRQSLSPATMSEVRIVLLGENVPLTSRVGNIILGRSAFHTEVLQSEKASGDVEGRFITIINTPHLYNLYLSQEEVIQRVKECFSLADPGPHVFLLVLQSELISHELQDRVRSILETYSPKSRTQTIMLTIGKVHGFISECDVRHHRIENLFKFDQHEVVQLLGKIDAVVKETGGSDSICKMSELLEDSAQDKKRSGTPGRHQDHWTETTSKTDRNLEESKGTKITQSVVDVRAPTSEEFRDKGAGTIDQSTFNPVYSTVSELRFILLGKSVSDTSSVGNLLLGRSVLETKDPLHSVLQCERVRGHVKGRNITIINAPHLFDQTFSHHQLTLCIKECVSLSAPGPHVIMLIVEPESFSETDKRRADHILLTLSEEAHKYTMVITTKNIDISSSVDPVEENVIQKVIAECNYRYLNFSGCTQANLVEKMEEMVKDNKGSLFCDIYEDAEPAIGNKMYNVQPETEETGKIEVYALQEHEEPDEMEKYVQMDEEEHHSALTTKEETCWSFEEID